MREREREGGGREREGERDSWVSYKELVHSFLS